MSDISREDDREERHGSSENASEAECGSDHHVHANEGGAGEVHAGHDHDHVAHHRMMMEDFYRRFWVSLALSAPIILLSPMIQGWLGLMWLAFPGSEYVQFGLATVVFLYGGWPFLKGFRDELAKRQPGMMFLIGLAVTVAYVYSTVVVFGVSGRRFFWELATLIDVMLLGHWIEMKSVLGASSALEELTRLLPADAHRLDQDGETHDVPISDLGKDDRVVVKPGERIPVDGTILEGRTSIDESMLTGESVPVSRSQDDEVVGGSVNQDGAIVVQVSKTGENTYLSQVVRTVREAQESKSRQQDFADRVAGWLAYIAIGAGAITFAAWLIAGDTFSFAMERMVTVMVITCPHALGLAVPLVVGVSTALAARRGLLIRRRGPFELARKLDAVVFDKTGTLTEGRFAVRDTITLSDESDEEILRIAAGLESRSEHPIAAAIVAHAKEREIQFPEPSNFENISGTGAEADVDGTHVMVVSPTYLEENGIDWDRGRTDPLAESGKTVVYVLKETRVVGAIALADVVRRESSDAVRRLKAMDIRVLMITGDSEAVARSVAGELGLDDVFAEVKPDDKSKHIRELRERGVRVAMVGDGVNDAPALAEADLGLAIGAGTEVAIQTADVVLVNSDPRDVVAVLLLSRATFRKMLQNLAWATGYNVLAIPLAAGVLAGIGIVLSPAVGALLMSASTVIVAINARFLRIPDNGNETESA